MRLQQIMPQQAIQYQHGYQINGLDLGQQQLSGANRHTFFQQHNALGQLNPGMGPTPTVTQPQPQGLSRVNGTERGSMESEKAEELKRKLRKRGIPEENWKYYLESPHSWDYTNVTSSGL